MSQVCFAFSATVHRELLKYLSQIPPYSVLEKFPLQKIHIASLFSDSLIEYIKSISENTLEGNDSSLGVFHNTRHAILEKELLN